MFQKVMRHRAQLSPAEIPSLRQVVLGSRTSRHIRVTTQLHQLSELFVVGAPNSRVMTCLSPTSADTGRALSKGALTGEAPSCCWRHVLELASIFGLVQSPFLQ